MNDENKAQMYERWAQLRFSVVGQLLSRPPKKGTLTSELKALSTQEWTHPQTGEPVRFGFSTIEHWYHRAKRSANPIKALTTEARVDSGKSRVISAALLAALRRQYEQHCGWSYFLHYENLAVVAADDPSTYGEMPSYSTLRRLMKRSGWTKKKRPKKLTPRKLAAIERKETLETRSYEAGYVGELAHLDFHVGSLCVIDAAGVWHKPEIFAMMDDLSRLCCHAQWYLIEDSENLIHGSEQAFLKRGLFRSLMSDKGGAMMSEEYQNGLRDLSILHQPTLAYSPNQNGKQERFWATLEGQLLPMLENVEHLTLDQLNLYTQAWVEQGYNHRRHSELKCSPVEKFCASPSVLRPSVDLAQMRLAFSKQTVRTQRKSDGTLSLDGVRFEIPSSLRLLDAVTVRYRPWDLSKATIVDPRSGVVLAVIRPLNKQKNADGKRRAFENPLPIPVPLDIKESERVAPVLKKMMANYAASGLPAAYIPKDELILSKTNPDKEE